MLILTTTTDTIRVVLGGTVTTNQMQCYTCYRDVTTTAYTPGRVQSTSNNSTAVNIVTAPASSTQRVIDYVSVFNADTVAQTATVSFNANGTLSTLWLGTLQANETLVYCTETGWQVLNAAGITKSSPVNSANSSAVMLPVMFSTANLTTVVTPASGKPLLTYMGKAPRALTSVQVRLRVTTLASTITWLEVAIGKGAIVIGGNPNVTPVGFLDVSGSHNTTGQKTHTITVSAGQVINEGDDLWLIIGVSASVVSLYRGISIADDLQVGTQGSATFRPSTNIGVSTAITLDTAVTTAIWGALIV